MWIFSIPYFSRVCTSTSATPPRATSDTATRNALSRSAGSVIGPAPQAP